jgi:hypothetical protein
MAGRRLPADNVRRFRNRLRGLRDAWRAGTISIGEVEPRVRAWIAHGGNAQTWRLRHAIFWGGRFDPRLTPKAWTPPCRCVARGASSFGTLAFSVTNNTPENARSASRNRNTTGKRNNNLGFRAGGTLFARAGATRVSPGKHLSVQGSS